MPVPIGLQKQRRAEGRCIQCGGDVDLNKNGLPFARCPTHLREGREQVARFHATHFRGEAALDESRAYLKLFRKLAEKRKAVADIRYVAHVRPTGWYATELLGNRVIR